MEKELSGYQLVVAPMLYLYRANIAEKMKKFVELGGTLVGTYWSGIVNDTDLCYLGGMPGRRHGRGIRPAQRGNRRFVRRTV